MEGLTQSGSNFVYDFLLTPSTPRETALGGSLITVADEDLGLAHGNPALLNEKMHNRILFGHNFHFADISHGYISYGRQFSSIGINTHAALKYISYGDFSRADVFGNQDGTFTANEWAMIIGASKALNERISVGANVKFLGSQLAGYNSYGAAFDFGAVYATDDNLHIGFSITNAGAEISTYTDSRALAPVNIQLGISKKLAHLPFRFSVIFHQLNQWNLLYDSELNRETDIFGNVIESSAFSQEIDNFFRHVIFNGELLLGQAETFRLRFGYNHRIRKELSVSGFRSLAGFSFGFGVKVSKFRLDYGVGHFHLVGATNHVGLSIDLDDFFKGPVN
ncbi:MAG: type IX secretion system protein PorQ [Saprospiraceae bacterium]|nr:type IX secretion system protein PorQ [Saprospiraceae bacterium]